MADSTVDAVPAGNGQNGGTPEDGGVCLKLIFIK